MKPLSAAAWMVCIGATQACGPSHPESPQTFAAPLSPAQASCEVEVVGIGALDVDGDYIPHVLACENDAAPDAALDALAIAARSYMSYTTARDGRIKDGVEAQVYSCRNEPLVRHYEAAARTRGRILVYRGDLVAGFHVAGAIPSTPDCLPAPADPDPSNTERLVTYNDGRAADEVFQTPLGLIDPANTANRGCLSQNGSTCLARAGVVAEAIVRTYYGADIEIRDLGSGCATRGIPEDVARERSDPASCQATGGPAGLGVPVLLLGLALLAVRRR